MEQRRIEDVVAQDGIYVGTTSGVSMYPMLRDRRDTIIIQPCQGRLKKYDVPLYHRGEKYVLHRIVKVLPDSYVICGDNCIRKEYGISDQQIIGVLTGFYRDGKVIDMNGYGYRCYARIWVWLYPFRVFTKFAGVVLRKVRKKAEKDEI